MQSLTVTVAATGRSGAKMYDKATSNVIVGTLTNEGHEAMVQPQEINGRVYVSLATGLSGWVDKRSVKFLKQLNINVIDDYE